MLAPLVPFIILLILSIIFSFIEMEPKLKQLGYLIIGIAAIILLLQFLHLM